jgi:hypothetical protein
VELNKSLSIADLLELKELLNLDYEVFIEHDLPKQAPISAIILIVKPDKHSGHWVCYHKISPTEIAYFNSLGVVIDENIEKFLKDYTVYYSDSMIQDFGSKWCGHYCLHFLYCLKNDPNFDFEEYLDSWGKDREVNDTRVHQELAQLLYIGSGVDTEKIISDYYYSPSGFQGVKKTYEKLKDQGITQKQVENFIKKQQINKITTNPNKTKSFLHYQSDHSNQFHQIDILFVDSYKGFKYILGVIDVHTRYLAMRPMKNKTAKTTLDLLKNIYTQDKYMKVPKVLQSDAGTEFNNTQMKTYLSENSAELRILPAHAHIIERVFQTIAKPLYAYRDMNYTKDWVTILPDVIASYNNSYHSTLRMTPVEAMNSEEIVKYYDKQPVEKAVFKVGDKVYVKKDKYDTTSFRAVDFKYDNDKVYEVSGVGEHPVVHYRLKDTAGVFYNNDLVLVSDMQNPIDNKRWSKVFK